MNKDTLNITEVTWQNVIKGNFSRLTFIHKEQKYRIKCLYAPNKDSVESDNNNESTKFFRDGFDEENDEDYQTTSWQGIIMLHWSMTKILADI